METIAWDQGRWTHQPDAVQVRPDGDLVVTARDQSDAWRITSYGFIHDSEHALVAPLGVGQAMEVVFTAAFEAEFDQAGLFVVADSEHWVKAGVEFADGVPQVGAVVTAGFSDWSVAPVPAWLGERVRVRVSRGPDSLTVRAARDGEALALVRVAPFDGSRSAEAGPMACAPSRPGLDVVFHSWQVGPADASLH